jgi:hypothetical protein
MTHIYEDQLYSIVIFRFELTSSIFHPCHQNEIFIHQLCTRVQPILNSIETISAVDCCFNLLENAIQSESFSNTVNS